MWQLIGAVVDPKGGQQQQGSLYLRGHLPNADSANWLDPCSVVKWEVAVVPGGRQAGTQTVWVKAPKLRLVRGFEGARLAAESGAPPMRWTEPAAPAAPPPEAEGIGVYEGKAKEEL